MSEDLVLALRDVHVHRGDAHVLQGVSFDVQRGGVTALLGRNGVGKTSTLMAVLGLVERSGSILINDVERAKDRTMNLVRLGIGYVPEDREVFPSLTVEENLRLAMRSRDSMDRLDRVHQLFPDLLARRAQRAGSLSGGQQQMVSIARVLLNENELLLVDEPTKGLAPAVVEHVIDAMREVAKETTILLVEQNLRVARALATSAIVLDHGTVVHRSSMDELFEDPEAIHAYLGVSVKGREIKTV